MFEKEMDEYGRTTRKGIWKIFWFIVIPLTLIGMIWWGFGWFSNAGKVAFDEFSPEAMLEKYEWFKDASATLDKKMADVKVYEKRVTDMKDAYEGVSRKDWARTDLDDYNLWTSEVAGIKASYNSLASQYNSEMAKFNWRFANVGELPKGATQPLPREYKPYLGG